MFPLNSPLPQIVATGANFRFGETVGRQSERDEAERSTASADETGARNRASGKDEKNSVPKSFGTESSTYRGNPQWTDIIDRRPTPRGTAAACFVSEAGRSDSNFFAGRFAGTAAAAGALVNL